MHRGRNRNPAQLCRLRLRSKHCNICYQQMGGSYTGGFCKSLFLQPWFPPGHNQFYFLEA